MNLIKLGNSQTTKAHSMKNTILRKSTCSISFSTFCSVLICPKNQSFLFSQQQCFLNLLITNNAIIPFSWLSNPVLLKVLRSKHLPNISNPSTFSQKNHAKNTFIFIGRRFIVLFYWTAKTPLCSPIHLFCFCRVQRRKGCVQTTKPFRSFILIASAFMPFLLSDGLLRREAFAPSP